LLTYVLSLLDRIVHTDPVVRTYLQSVVTDRVTCSVRLSVSG